jgi:hypothetical protein
MDRKLPPKDTPKFLIDLDDHKKLDSEYTTSQGQCLTQIQHSYWCQKS